MTTQQISALILQAITIKREIELREEILEELKASLRNEAMVELEKEGIKGEKLPGSSYTFKASDESVATVSFPRPELIKSFVLVEDFPHVLQDKKLVRMKVNVQEAAGPSFKKLFLTSYSPAKSFRELAPALLHKATADKILGACELEPGQARVTFKVAGRSNAAAPAGAEPS